MRLPSDVQFSGISTPMFVTFILPIMLDISSVQS
nr:MAG TPA: hypothetical protein [Caudoviricetes sp.]